MALASELISVSTEDRSERNASEGGIPWFWGIWKLAQNILTVESAKTGEPVELAAEDDRQSARSFCKCRFELPPASTPG